MATANKTPRSRTIDLLHDKRVDCFSIVLRAKVSTYLDLVGVAYLNRGGVEGQREKLRTTSAIRIRRRMVQDIVEGAVLPPVVVGVVLDEPQFAAIPKMKNADLVPMIQSLQSDRLSIIDGMQRTTALSEAQAELPAVGIQTMRVEFWISRSTNSLIYRMLVLNTGQVPWNLRAQVEAVFKSIILEVDAGIPDITVLSEGARRSGGGQFQANELVELFLVFGARKEKIDIRERLADEFTRLDFMEAASDREFTQHFCTALAVLVQLDVAFDKYRVSRQQVGTNKSVRFASGKDLFASQPACVGLMTAIAIAVAGRPGVSRALSDQAQRLQGIVRSQTALSKRLTAMSYPDLHDFLGFQTLNEAIAKGRSSLSVGDMEREFFLRAFQVLLEENVNLVDMTACWRAY